jgi:hypothetical protein
MDFALFAYHPRSIFFAPGVTKTIGLLRTNDIEITAPFPPNPANICTGFSAETGGKNADQ